MSTDFVPYYQGFHSGKPLPANTSAAPWDAQDTDPDNFHLGDDQDDDKTSHIGRNAPKFACPFFKRNPETFRNSRSCTGPGWATVRRTKEHLYRHHFPLACSRCYRCFPDEKGLADHNKDGKCPKTTAVARKPDGLTAEQVKQLRKRKREAEKSEDKKWVEMYRIVFPHDGGRTIPSPYYDYAPSGAVSRGQSSLASEFGSPLPNDHQDAQFQYLMEEIRRTMQRLRGETSDRAIDMAVDDVQRLVSASLGAVRPQASAPSRQPDPSQGAQPHGGDYVGFGDASNIFAGIGDGFVHQAPCNDPDEDLWGMTGTGYFETPGVDMTFDDLPGDFLSTVI